MTTPPDCTKAWIDSAPDACAFVKEWCTDQYKFLDFPHFYYCDIHQSVPLIVVISILFIIFVFNLLGSTADRYLSPALETVSERLKLSEAIAGVTLVALANGATDVIAGLVAGTKGDDGFPIAVGALFGACFFTVTCVLARCLQGCPVIKVVKESFIRDICFLLIATVYFVILIIINEITPPLAAVFFLFYVCYFAVVIYQNRKKPQDQDETKERLLSGSVKRDLSRFGKSRTLNEANMASLLGSYVLKQSAKKKLARGRSAEYGGSLVVGKLGSSKIYDEESEVYNQKKLSKIDVDEEDKEKATSEQAEEEEEDNSLFGKIMKVYNWPFNMIRDLTMPPFEEDRWNVYLAAVTPFCAVLFFLWQFDLFQYFLHDWYLWIVYAAITVPPALWILIKGRNCQLGVEHAGSFAAVTFLISGLWLSFIVTCFMDFLSLLTIISGLPLNYLSLTMLAWGNSLDDFFVDYVICKSGNGPMAVTGVYAGQLFNLLIGFGGSIFIQSIKKTIIPNIFDFSGVFGSYDFQTNLLTVILLGCLISGLLLSLLFGFLSKWALGRKMMVFVLTLYLSFFITVTVLTLV